MSQSTVNLYIRLFSQAFNALGIGTDMATIERLSLLVHRSMEQPRRVYHNSEHVFKLIDGMNPHQTLAGLFHDVVYVQLDDGFAPWAADWLVPVVAIENGQYAIRHEVPPDRSIQMCLDVFGFEPGQQLSPFAGLNEFLSAIVAVRALSDHLPLKRLLAIVSCIEATIPFRAVDGQGVTLSRKLHHKVSTAAARAGLALTEGEVSAIVREAMVLANRDVAGFGFEDPGQFLSDTWMLIDESNAPLSRVGVYTIGDYRQALQRMLGFLKSLDYRSIFNEESENDPVFVARQAAAKRNLAFSVRYLSSKLLSISILEELAKLTGGDAPISMFLGDIRSSHSVKIQDFLRLQPDVQRDMDPFMLDILENGRPQPSRNDTAASPITAYLYRWLGEAGMTQAAEATQRLIANQITSTQFLRSLPASPLRELIAGCASISLSRSEPLHRLAVELLS